jgi:hypothetical protein
VLDDDAIEVHVNEVEPGRGSPMSKQPRLDVLSAQRLTQQRIVHKIDLPNGQVVGRAPIGIHGFQHAPVQGLRDIVRRGFVSHSAPPMLQ